MFGCLPGSYWDRVELTDAGPIFVDEARLAIFHAERALNLARAADRRSSDALMIGYSPDADHACVSGILATRLPSYTNVRIRLCTRFAMDLVRNVLVGEMNLALVTAPPEESRITAAPFARRSLYAVLPDSHRYAGTPLDSSASPSSVATKHSCSDSISHDGQNVIDSFRFAHSDKTSEGELRDP